MSIVVVPLPPPALEHPVPAPVTVVATAPEPGGPGTAGFSRVPAPIAVEPWWRWALQWGALDGPGGPGVALCLL